MTQQVKETIEQAEEQIKKFAMFVRAELGLPIKDEERGVLIQPGQIEERTRVQPIQVAIHTYLRTLYDVTGFNIYKDVADHFDRYDISLEGLGRQEYIADRQPKVVTPAPSMTNVTLQQGEKDGKKEKK